jgi:hypothetical protein
MLRSALIALAFLMTESGSAQTVRTRRRRIDDVTAVIHRLGKPKQAVDLYRDAAARWHELDRRSFPELAQAFAAPPRHQCPGYGEGERPTEAGSTSGRRD